MQHLDQIQKLAVLHCVYQLIASADGNVQEERDEVAIELAFSKLELNKYTWDAALKLNPHDCFIHIAQISESDQLAFKELMISIAGMGGNTDLRMICANHLFQFCQIKV